MKSPQIDPRLSPLLTLSPRRRGSRPVSVLAAAALAGISVSSFLHAAEVVFQAESFTSTAGTGGGFGILPDPFAAPNGSGQYITTLGNNTTATTPDTTATFTLSFPTAGTYTLYVRGLAEDAGGQGSNDSFMVPTDFGATPTFANRLNNFGNTTPDPARYAWVNTFTRDGLEAGGQIDSAAPQYTIAAGTEGARTFVIGGRENGFRLDAFVFSTDSTLTAAALNSLANVPPPPPPPAFLNVGPQGGQGFFGIREVRNNGLLNNTTEASNSLTSNNSNPALGTRFEGTAPVINTNDPDAPGGGFFAGKTPFLSNTPGLDDDDIALIANGTLRVPTESDYTFGFNSDDGARLKIQGAAFTSATGGGFNGDTLEFPGPTGASNTLGVTHLLPGDYRLEFVFFERAGGAFAELYAAPGVFTAFDAAQFDLIGDTANGGLQLVPEPSTGLLALSGMAGLLDLARRRRGGRSGSGDIS